MATFVGIEFGSGGESKLSGYKTCDVRNIPGIDYVCDAWDINKHVESNTINEIYSRHFFEHLTFEQGKLVLNAWHKILKPGGKIRMKLPNLEYQVHEWLKHKEKNGKFDNPLMSGFWGWQRQGDKLVWDVHKSGYDIETLKHLLIKHNFTNIISHQDPDYFELDFEFYKPKRLNDE